MNARTTQAEYMRRKHAGDITKAFIIGYIASILTFWQISIGIAGILGDWF